MCCESLAKCFLIIINIGFFLLGAVFLVIGILVKVDADALLGEFSAIPVVSTVSDLISAATDQLDDFNSDLTALLENSGWILIGVGGVIFIIGFLGLCGACYGNKVYLWTYAFIVLLILLVEVGLVIFVLIEGDNVEDDIIELLQKTLEDYAGVTITPNDDGTYDFSAPSDIISLSWDTFHVSLECCGVENYTDFAEHSWKDAYSNFTELNGTVLVPATCCPSITLDHFPDKLDTIDPEETLQCMMDPAKYAHQQGCYTRVMHYLEQYMYIVIGVACGIVLIQILAIVAGCSLSRKSK